MKKALFLLCILLALQLSGCNQAPQSSSNTEDREQTSQVPSNTKDREQTSQVPSNTEDREQASQAPSNTEDREQASQSSSGAEASGPCVLKVPPEDRNQAFIGGSFVETPDCYYHLRDGLIFFCPRGTAAFYPLCGKPNCSHSDENCNAWCGEGGSFGYYDGALYAADANAGSIRVVRMNLDGTDHEVVANVDTSKFGIYYCVFHHGKLFIAGQDNPSKTDLREPCSVIAFDLSDYSQKELAADYFADSVCTPDLFCFYKDKIYVNDSRLGTGEPGSDEGARFVELDAETGEVRTLASKSIGWAYATDTTLYYLEKNTSYLDSDHGDEVEGAENPGFREYDLKTGEVKDCGLPVADARFAVYDEDYIYLWGFPRGTEDEQKMTFYFLSRDYQLIDQIELNSNEWPALVTSDRVLLYDFSLNAKQNTLGFYLDKSKIGSHDLKLEPIENH